MDYNTDVRFLDDFKYDYADDFFVRSNTLCWVDMPVLRGI